MTAQKVLVSIDLQMDLEQTTAITSDFDGQEGSTSQKVGRVALGLLEELAEGGMMLNHRTVSGLSQALGKEVEEADVLEKFEAGCGMQGGHHIVMLPIDPINVGFLQQMADANGIPSVELLMRRLIDDLWDNGYFQGAIPQGRRVLMSDETFAKMTELVGPFDNGTELADLIEKKLKDAEVLF